MDEKNQKMDKKSIEHSADFWAEIQNNCFRKTGTFGTDSIKIMIKTGKMTIYDSNHWDWTLLHIAAMKGAYDLVQFLINNGADVNAKDEDGDTALDNARGSGYSHIEKLLLFAQMNVEAGNEIQDIAQKIQQQNGINECLSEELSDIGQQSKNLFEEMTMELMTRMITKKKTFSDNQLVYAMNIAMNENENILSSKLWLQIRSTVSDIVKNGDMKDWVWLKQCLLPSTIWYKDISSTDSKEPHYLYYELLKLVSIEAMNQINNLDANLMKMADKQKADWLALVKWDIPNEYESARQDMIVNGIASRYTFDQLSVSSGTTFNAPNFYDHNQYLSQLALLAQIGMLFCLYFVHILCIQSIQYLVDEEFHASVQKMFEIDPVSNKGKIASFDDEKTEGGVVEYMRGPVKLMNRARAKAQNDYANEPYPASACVIDFNRCALIFDDISSMLNGLKLFVNKVKNYQSGNIIAIARDKNGFIEYLKEAQYADIKLNVVIKGKHNSIIGEVQFLLRAMKEYKEVAHNLYAIQRKEEAIKSSVSATLPILLDQQKEIVGIACSGSVKKMCSLMITQNMSIKDLLFVDKKSGGTILTKVFGLGHLKLLMFLKSMMSRKRLIENVFLSNKKDIKCIEVAVNKAQLSILKYLLDMEEVRDRYKNNDPMIFRLCIALFVYNTNTDLTEYVLSSLQISKEKVVQMLSYKCPQQSEYRRNAQQYHYFSLIDRIIFSGSFDHLLRLIAVIGKQAFIDNVFNLDGWNSDAMHSAVDKKHMKIIEYILSMNEIKAKYMSDNNLLFRLVSTLNEYITNKEAVQYVVDSLGLTEAKLSELKAFRNIDVEKIIPFTK